MNKEQQKDALLGLALAAAGAYLIYYSYGLCVGEIEAQLTCMIGNAKQTIMSIAGIALVWHGVDRAAKNTRF